MTEDELQDGLSEVRRTVQRAMERTSMAPLVHELSRVWARGKMLRARLVLRMGSACGRAQGETVTVGAAVEMLHAASLLHDDVIDGGELRRQAPSFWVEKD